MSGSSRLDRLEREIVAGLRDAPGPSPSSALDARILARAHAAVAAPKRRPQPRWFSLAAGITVLVGSGLALRIWQQLEHAPSALDAPVAPVSAPAAAPTMADEASPAPAAGAAAATSSATAASAPADLPEPARKDVDKSEAKPDATLRRELAPAQPVAPAASGLVSDSEAADDFNRAAPEALAQPRPFPAEPRAPEPAAVPSVAAAPPAEQSTPSAPAPAPAMKPTPAAAPPLPAAAAPTTTAKMLAEPVRDAAPMTAEQPATRSQAAAAGEIARQLGANGALPATGASAFASGAEDGIVERDRGAVTEDQRSDPFNDGVIQVRGALAAGDTLLAWQLLQRLHRDFPERELPKDLREFADLPK